MNRDLSVLFESGDAFLQPHCDPFETDGKYQLPAGDQALQLLQC